MEEERREQRFQLVPANDDIPETYNSQQSARHTHLPQTLTTHTFTAYTQHTHLKDNTLNTQHTHHILHLQHHTITHNSYLPLTHHHSRPHFPNTINKVCSFVSFRILMFSFAKYETYEIRFA